MPGCHDCRPSVGSRIERLVPCVISIEAARAVGVLRLAGEKRCEERRGDPRFAGIGIPANVRGHSFSAGEPKNTYGTAASC